MTKTRTKKFGRGANQCKRCGRKRALVRKYGIYLCRQCFREKAMELGFKKYW
ncbi:MAG: 30S ribosomal protein S14 [Archaeoglobi archaeon]|jgi:small subunit ribosomal protein S14|nr:30S ribosomal protein S14 [Archaeoglobi archaeon]